MKWFTLDSYDGERTLKQHCYVAKERIRRYTREKYAGNISLCGMSGVGNEDEEYEPYEAIISEAVSETACKKCIKIFSETKPPTE